MYCRTYFLNAMDFSTCPGFVGSETVKVLLYERKGSTLPVREAMIELGNHLDYARFSTDTRCKRNTRCMQTPRTARSVKTPKLREPKQRTMLIFYCETTPRGRGPRKSLKFGVSTLPKCRMHRVMYHNTSEKGKSTLG